MCVVIPIMFIKILGWYCKTAVLIKPTNQTSERLLQQLYHQIQLVTIHQCHQVDNSLSILHLSISARNTRWTSHVKPQKYLSCQNHLKYEQVVNGQDIINTSRHMQKINKRRLNALSLKECYISKALPLSAEMLSEAKMKGLEIQTRTSVTIMLSDVTYVLNKVPVIHVKSVISWTQQNDAPRNVW